MANLEGVKLQGNPVENLIRSLFNSRKVEGKARPAFAEQEFGVEPDRRTLDARQPKRGGELLRLNTAPVIGHGTPLIGNHDSSLKMQANAGRVLAWAGIAVLTFLGFWFTYMIPMYGIEQTWDIFVSIIKALIDKLF